MDSTDDLEDRLPPSIATDPWERALREVLDGMDREVAQIVVEGPNDRQALRKAGLDSPIEECSQTAGLTGFADQLTGDPIAILTDFDDAGRRLNGRLRDVLPDARVATHWRREVGLVLTQHGHYEIESLNNVFKRRL